VNSSAGTPATEKKAPRVFSTPASSIVCWVVNPSGM
jgi:hypothetical protein